MNGEFHIVSGSVLEQIDVARESLERIARDFYTSQKLEAFLSRAARRHSVEIESPPGKRVNHGRLKRQALENLKLAHCYFLRNYHGNLSNQLVSNCNALILGTNIAPYRTCTSRTRLSSKSLFEFTNPEKISEEMELFIKGCWNLKDPIEKAVFSHFNLARIHPYDDGNGRVARLVQNGILETANYPPIIICPFDRAEYIRLISAASREHREERGAFKSNQRKFYDYLALKLRDSLVEARRKSKISS